MQIAQQTGPLADADSLVGATIEMGDGADSTGTAYEGTAAGRRPPAVLPEHIEEQLAEWRRRAHALTTAPDVSDRTLAEIRNGFEEQVAALRREQHTRDAAS